MHPQPDLDTDADVCTHASGTDLPTPPCDGVPYLLCVPPLPILSRSEQDSDSGSGSESKSESDSNSDSDQDRSLTASSQSRSDLNDSHRTSTSDID